MQINRNYSNKRLLFFAIVSIILVCAVMFSYARLILKPLTINHSITVLKERGSILDRNGKILAIQTTVYNLSANPSRVSDIENTALILSPIINIPPAEISRRIKENPTDFLYLKKKINQSEQDDIQNAIKMYKLKGLQLEKTVARSYPENALASQVIGFMGNDGDGLTGIEYSMEKVLAPQKDPTQTGNYGKNVVLTLDAGLQYKLEQIAAKAMQSTSAESMMLIAAEAKTGEILSYISLPAANLNFYSTATREEKQDLPAVYDYEPGSVFKIFSIASFIDEKAITPSQTFFCDGVYDIKTVNGEQVRITCLDKHGAINAREALQYSCNEALAQMSEKISSEVFLQRIRQFGFASKTGIELPSEAVGTLRSTSDKFWSGRSKPTIAIGQEMSVTALQMVSATTAIANEGKPVQLTLISKIVNKDGVIEYQHKPQIKDPILAPETAKYILSCMETTARLGTGSRAAINDVQIGVKTGTAQMSNKDGYIAGDFVSNCVAVFPIENPKIILYIVITRAKGENYAGRIVAPVIREAANIIIDHLGLNREGATSVAHTGKFSIPNTAPIKIGKTIPDFTGLPKRLLTPLLDRKDLNIIIQGEGWVTAQKPAPGTPVTENMTIELTLQ